MRCAHRSAHIYGCSSSHHLHTTERQKGVGQRARGRPTTARCRFTSIPSGTTLATYLTLIPSHLPPKRDCTSKRARNTAGIDVFRISAAFFVGRQRGAHNDKGRVGKIKITDFVAIFPSSAFAIFAVSLWKFLRGEALSFNISIISEISEPDIVVYIYPPRRYVHVTCISSHINRTPDTIGAVAGFYCCTRSVQGNAPSLIDRVDIGRQHNY